MSKKTLKQIFGINRLELLLASSALLLFLVFAGYFTYFYFAKDLGSKETIMNAKAGGVVLLDRNDQPFFSFYDAKTTAPVSLSEIPDETEKAIIAIEDKDFYSHPGFSIKSIIRSLYKDIAQQELAYGGSTITQQLVKNALLTSKKDFLRKYQELILAREIERKFEKDEILEMYLNSVYFGRGALGIQEAALTYFGKDVKDLNLSESAYLAGLLPAPTRISSNKNNEAINRQHLVLKEMLEQGFINTEAKEKAQYETLDFKTVDDNVNSIAPHFALMIKEELLSKYGEERLVRSGFKVKTTLNSVWQMEAEKIVKDQVAKIARNKVSNGAALVMDPKTGEILVMVGSTNWSDSQFGKVNITTSLRQPGSAFKPIVYSEAIEQKTITAATPLKDDPITYKTPVGDYKPNNFDFKFRGTVLTRRALVNSLNIPAVEVMNKVGVERTIEHSKKLGITTITDPSRYGLSLVLGTGEVKMTELVGAYATFANYGTYNPPVTILEITDKNNNKIYMHESSPKQVISPGTAFVISSILADNAARAEVFGNSLNISRQAAAKTGTTQNFKDGWTLGYTPNLVTGVWVGNNDATPMDRVAGSLGAAPIWRGLMEAFLKDLPVERFTPPQDISSKAVCRTNGGESEETGNWTYMEYFLPGTGPTGRCAKPEPSPAPETQQQNQGEQNNPAPTPQPQTEQTQPDINQIISRLKRNKNRNN